MRYFWISVIFLALFSVETAFAKPFTVVIDAGHGGHDSGAVGKIIKEKNVNLAVALLVGKMIEENYPDIKVVYTRKTDRFLPLQERADIVNGNNADVFICIHANANNSSAAYGTETYTLGVNSKRTKGNLEVAMRENSVILLEDDYKTRYQGFDPRSVDSYIMFEFMQDKYMDSSIQLASAIQKQFVRGGRYDRGVRQDVFWVLYKSACPSVLVEMGFLSNRAEEEYLSSAAGQQNIASSIYRAFLSYKKDYDKKNGKTSKIRAEDIYKEPKIPETDTLKEVQEGVKQDTPTANTASATACTQPQPQTQSQQKNTEGTVYKVQIAASKYKFAKNDPELKGFTNTGYYLENGMYKYTSGEFLTFDEANQFRRKIAKDFPNAFVVTFKNGKRVK